MASSTFVVLEPEELFFRDVKLSQVYTQTLRITNTLRGPVELTLKPGSSERYTVVPNTLRLKGGEAATVDVRLRVIRFVQRQKAEEQGQRDVFHIKGSHFDQKFHATFWLAPDNDPPGKARAGSAAPIAAGPSHGRPLDRPSRSRSPPASPRGRRAVAKSVSFAEPSSPGAPLRASSLPSAPASAPRGRTGFVSSSIDFGELQSRRDVPTAPGERFGGDVGVSPGRQRSGRGPSGHRPPPGPSHSLPSSPGRPNVMDAPAALQAGAGGAQLTVRGVVGRGAAQEARQSGVSKVEVAGPAEAWSLEPTFRGFPTSAASAAAADSAVDGSLPMPYPRAIGAEHWRAVLEHEEEQLLQDEERARSLPAMRRSWEAPSVQLDAQTGPGPPRGSDGMTLRELRRLGRGELPGSRATEPQPARQPSDATRAAWPAQEPGSAAQRFQPSSSPPGYEPQGSALELHVRMRTLERQHASMRRTVEEQQEVLRDKSALLQAVQLQLEEAKAELTARAAARADHDVEQLAAERATLLTERSALAARLAEAEAALACSQEEATALRRLQLELQSRQPDVARAVEAAVSREQVIQEDRNRKALELLMTKDARVAELDDQVAELQRANAQQQTQLSELRERAQVAESQVMELLRQKEALAEAARKDRQEADNLIADLEARLALGEDLVAELQAARELAITAEHHVADAQHRLLAAEQRAAEAEARVLDLEAEKRMFRLARDDHVDTALAMAEEMRSRCAELQDQHAEAMRVQAEGYGKQISELEAKISALIVEAAEAQTVAAQKGGAVPADGAQAGLDAFIKADSSLSPSARGTTDQEAANAKLEVGALRRHLASATMAAKERAWEQAELERLRTLLSERDIEVAEMTSQLELQKARLASFGPGHRGGTPGSSPAASPRMGGRATAGASPARGRHAPQAPGHGSGRARSAERESHSSDGQAAVVEALRRQLAKSEAALRGTQERLALMEARAAVAQETAGRGEQRLEAVHRGMVGSALEHERLQQELESAHATAAKLNGRINDLAMAEQVARAEVDAAKAKLGQLQDLHTAEMSTLQQRLQRVTEHLAATQPEVLAVLLGSEYEAPSAQPASGGGFAGRHASAGAQLASQHVGGPDLPVSREQELEKALDAAETAVAVMQARLLDALKAAADAGEEAARVRREAEWERDRLEAEVRAAREEGALRIRMLEESVSRLGARGGDAAQALARSAAEADAAVRRESRLRSELALTQQAAKRANAQAAELRLQLRDCEQSLREAQVYGCLLLLSKEQAGPDASDAAAPAPSAQAPSPRERADAPGKATAQSPAPGGQQARGPVGRRPTAPLPSAADGMAASGGGVILDAQLEAKLRQQAAELTRKQQVIARLVDVAERAQAEAAAAQAELDRLRQALPDPKQPLQQQYADVQRRLGATEAELRACRDTQAACELEVARLQQQLAERARELDLAAERLAVCERDVASKEDAAARKAIEVRGAMGKEVTLLNRRIGEMQRALDEAESRARELDTQLGNLRAEHTEAQAELDSQAAEMRQLRLKGRDEKRAAEDAVRQANRAAELAKQEAQERRSQVSLMMETIEVLQAGNAGEREQRIVSLTAQLSAMTSREALAEQRALGLLADTEASSSRAQQLESEITELSEQVARLEQQLAAATSSRLMLEGELATARSDVRSRDAAALRAARELDDREQRVASLETELEAVRRALNECQGRHVEQLAREREEGAAAVRQARAESSSAAAASTQALRLERFQASLDELFIWIESKVQQHTAKQDGYAATEGAGPSSSWLLATLQRLKALALESEREYLLAATDARVYRTESRWAWARVKQLQMALEQRSGEWQVAQARLQQLERSLARRAEEAALHALEQVALQDKQLSAINDRLQATTAKMVAATSQAAGAEAALATMRAKVATLQRQAGASAAERKELQARLAAAEMEASGSAEVLHLGAEAALAQRDLAIRQYWDTQVASLLAKPEAKDKVMALAREVCALKLSESQLQAALAAARHRGDASAQLAANLTAALRASEETAERLMQRQPLAGASGADESADSRERPSAAASSLGVEVARLSAQIAAQSHETFRLQEAALRARQAYERRESDIQELQAQVAASELLLSQVRAEGTAALLALKGQLTEAHEHDRQTLLREIRELQDRLAATRESASKDVESVQERIAEATLAADAEVEKRVSAAMAEQVDVHLRGAEDRALTAERKAVDLALQIDALQDALTAAQAQIGDLEDIRDVTGAAVASLEATLARIEKAASTGAGAAVGRQSMSTPLGSRRPPLAGATASASIGRHSEESAQGLGSHSRELVRAKMSEAEAVRKMRAAARSELDLRQKLLQRDERITELKEQLAAKVKSLEELRRRAFPQEAGARPAQGAGSSASGSASKPMLRSRSPSPARGSAAPAAGHRRSASGVADREAAAEASDTEHLARQVSQLRLDLAKSQAEVERLQGALADANAAARVRVELPRPPTVPPKASGQANTAMVDRLKDQLASSNAEIASALSIANSMLRRLHQQSSMPGTHAGTSRRAGSPARRLAGSFAAGAASADPLTPGKLSGVMQQLLDTLQAWQLDGAVAHATSGAGRAMGESRQAVGWSAPEGAAPQDAALVESPTRAAPSQEALDEVFKLRHECAVLSSQRDELCNRCSQLETETLHYQELVQQLQAAARKPDPAATAEQEEQLRGAMHLSAALEGSVAAVHRECDRVQVAAVSGRAKTSDMREAMEALTTELGAMETTLELLKAQLDKAVQSIPRPVQHAPAAAGGVANVTAGEAVTGDTAEALVAAKTQVAALTTAALQQKARGDKWKQRSKELGGQLSLLTASVAAREAAASERQAASGQQAEDELRRCKAEMDRLQAALAGAEAARRELETAHGAGGNDARAFGARAAEATARAATLHGQLEAERAQAAAAAVSHQEEVASLKAALAQEKGERARLIVSLRESHASAQQAGDMDGKLRNEVLEAHSDAAAARAASERAEERAAVWREEAETLRQRLQQVERSRAQLLSDLEARVLSVERRAAEGAAAAAARMEDLTAKLAVAEAVATNAPRALEAKLREAESQLANVHACVEAVKKAVRKAVTAGRWSSLARVARYQASLKQMQDDSEADRVEWHREKTALQAAASEAARRNEGLAVELAALHAQMEELQTMVDADRQQLASRHVAHIQEMQQRIEDERRAMAEEAAARAAAAAASESAAEAAAASRAAALEADYGRRVSLLESERMRLARELELMQAQFSNYQAQKATEVAALEQRIRSYIDGGLAPVGPKRTRVTHDSELDDDDPGRRVSGPGGARRPTFGGSSHVARRQRPFPSRKGPGYRRAAGASAAHPTPVFVPTVLSQPPHQPGAMPFQPAALGSDLLSAGLQQPAPPQLAPSQLLALARGAEALAAAQREVAFEKSLRSRVEAQMGVVRSAMARLRSKLRTVTEQLEQTRANAIPQDEHRQLLIDLAACREQLRSCRAESARRQKALQTLQGMLLAQPGAAAPPFVISAADDDPLPAALEAAAAGARATASALEAEKAARQALEAKLRDAKAALERKAAHAKDLKRRLDELEAAAQQRAAAATEDAAAEARAKALTAAVARKDTVIRELRERLEAAQASAAAGSAAAEAGSEELEAARRTTARLKADLAKRDAALRTAVTDLEKERKALAAATKQLGEMARRDAATRRQAGASTAALRSHAGELLEALRGASRVLLQALAAMDVAADRLHLAGINLPKGRAGSRTAAADRAAGSVSASASSMSAIDISELTSLSLEDVRHLLGPDAGGAKQGQRLHPLSSGDAAKGPAVAASLAAAQRVGQLLSVVESALAAATHSTVVAVRSGAQEQATRHDGDLLDDEELLRDQLLAAVAEAVDPAAAVAAVLDGRGRTSRAVASEAHGGPRRGEAARRGKAAAGADGPNDPWDVRTLQTLMELLQAEAQRAERELADALRVAGVM